MMPVEEDFKIAAGCAACCLCKGASYQSYPHSHLGMLGAPIVIVAQNPGVITPAVARQPEVRWLKTVADLDVEEKGQLLYFAYLFSFLPSRANAVFSSWFGSDWLVSGEFMYTNAVRCRTKNNARPSEEMKGNCHRTWTAPLVNVETTKAVITIGSFAASAVLGAKWRRRTSWYKIASHPALGLVLPLQHYASRSLDPVLTRKAIKQLRRKVDGR